MLCCRAAPGPRAGSDGAIRIDAGFDRTLRSSAVCHPAADSRDRHSCRAGRHAGQRPGDGRGQSLKLVPPAWPSASRLPWSRCARSPCSWFPRCVHRSLNFVAVAGVLALVADWRPLRQRRALRVEPAWRCGTSRQDTVEVAFRYLPQPDRSLWSRLRYRAATVGERLRSLQPTSGPAGLERSRAGKADRFHEIEAPRLSRTPSAFRGKSDSRLALIAGDAEKEQGNRGPAGIGVLVACDFLAGCLANPQFLFQFARQGLRRRFAGLYFTAGNSHFSGCACAGCRGQSARGPRVPESPPPPRSCQYWNIPEGRGAHPGCNPVA